MTVWKNMVVRGEIAGKDLPYCQQWFINSLAYKPLSTQVE